MKKENPFPCRGCPAFEKSIFAGLNDAALEDIHKKKSSFSFRRGDFFYEQDQNATGVFCICSGVAKVIQTGDDGKSSIVRLLTSGDVAGSLEPVHSTGTYPIEEVRACFISQEDIVSLFRKHPDLSMNALRKLYKIKNHFQKTLAISLRMNVKERTCQLLHELVTNFGRQLSGGTEIDLPLTREEMASMIGVASETLIRVLSELKALEVITQNGRKIIVLKPNELIVKHS